MDVSYTGYYSPILDQGNGYTIQFTTDYEFSIFPSVISMIRGKRFENIVIKYLIFDEIGMLILKMKRDIKKNYENTINTTIRDALK